MACVIEFPIVRQERLDDEGVGHCLGMAELSFAGDEAGVVLARPAVVVFLRPIDGDAAEDDGDAVQGSQVRVKASFAQVLRSKYSLIAISGKMTMSA